MQRCWPSIQIFVSPTQRNPGLYCTEFPHKQKVKSETEYAKLFENQTSSGISGEGTVVYIYSPTALGAIKMQNPACKLIVMLRNPIDLVCSLHSNQFRSLEEDRPNLSEAWALQNERLQGNHLPRTCREPFFLQYQEVASQGKYLYRLYEHFEQAKVLPVLLEDFTSNPQAEYGRILQFLDVPYVHYPDFAQKINVNMEFKPGWKGILGQSLLRLIRTKHAGSSKKKLGIGNLRIEATLRQLSLTRSEREPVSHDLRRKLIDAFTAV